MLAILVALSICLISAISRIWLRLGMDKSNALTGMVFSLVIGWIALSIFTFFLVPAEAYNWQGVLFFAMIGVIAPPIVRYFTYLGIDTLGPAWSDQLRSLTPFFAIFFAIIFLKEPASLWLFLSTAAIFSGVILLVRTQAGLAGQSRHWKVVHIFYPVLGALFAGGVANLRKVGGTMLESSLLGATVAATSGLIVFALFLLVTRKWRNLVVESKSGKYFVAAGFCTGATDVLDLVALKHGRVSVVVPILATSPLFVLVLSRLFLGRREQITLKLVMSALLIFAGVETIILFAK
jgi:uncharacterized membrane protein